MRTHTNSRWEFNIVDTSNLTTQAFNTSCHYYGDSAYYFAMDDYPVDQPCNNPNVTFSLYPTGSWFQLNVTHSWGNCGTRYFIPNPSSSPSMSLSYVQSPQTDTPQRISGRTLQRQRHLDLQLGRRAWPGERRAEQLRPGRLLH
jgi:hypothetical protein